jgi:hypothetical protein
MINVLKNGTCPFTGKPYDCGKCDLCKTLKQPKGAFTLHISLYFGDAILDGKRGIKWLRKAVGAEHTEREVEEYFTALFRMGADHVPIGDLCDKFCFRRGCMGHPKEGGVK